MPKKVKEKPALTIEDHYLVAEKMLYDRRTTPFELIPAPTRLFKVGDSVRVGCLDDVVIVKVLQDGLAYVYSYTKTERHQEPRTCYQANFWFDVQYIDTNNSVPRLFSTHRVYSNLISDLASLVGFIGRGGLVCDPRYQRDYVWSEENKDALIESIFDRLDIGNFLFIRHASYKHKENSGSRTYKLLNGKTVEIKRCEDDTVAIIDGQQRLTTIMDFILDVRPYKGVYFSHLNWHDQHEFYSKSIPYRIIEEEQVTEKEILRMFLQANRGVPQAPEHLAKVQALYETMV